MKKIGIFCVGTGGHVLPAKNMIKELNDKNIGLENIVVITDKRGSQYFENMEVNIHIQNIYRSNNGIIGYLFNFNKILKSINNIKYLIKKKNIKVIFCTGSYIAPIASYLCMLLKIKYFGQEQNIYGGLGNKVSSYFPGIIFTSYPDTKNLRKKNIKFVGPIFNKNLFWRKVEIFCQVLNGEVNKANLSLTLLKEDNNFNDENFLKIIDSLLYKEELISENLDNLDLLNLAITRVANISIKENYVLKEDPLFLTMVYRMPNVPIKLRIEAIEKSKKLLNLPIETIEEIYNSYDIEKKDKKISLDDNILLGFETQAILYQMAIAEDNNEKKAKIIKKSLDLASINGNFNLISRLNLNSLMEIKPSKGLSWFANYATKSLLVSNKEEEAMEWYEILKKERDKSAELFNNFIELWAIVEFYSLRNKEKEYKNISQEEVLKSINKFHSQDQILEFSTLGFYLLEMFSVEINPEFWLFNLENNEIDAKQLPNSSLISLLKNSSKNKKVGETILLILMSLDGKNFNQLHPFFLQIVISSLNEIGLQEKTFDLAIETLIDR